MARAAERKFAGTRGGVGGGRGRGRPKGSSKVVQPFFELSSLESSSQNSVNEFDLNHLGGKITFVNPHNSVDDTKYPDADWIKPTFYETGFEIKNNTQVFVKKPYRIVEKQSGDIVVPEEMKNLNFSMSFESVVTSSTAATTSSVYQTSYADVTLGNLRTYSGDVHRARIFAKRQNQLNDEYTKLGDFLLQPKDELVDTDSVSETAPIGLFYSQNIINSNWISSSNSTATQNNSEYIGAVSLSGSNEGNGQSYIFQTKNNIVFEKKQDYQVTFDLYYEKTDKSGSYSEDTSISVEKHAEIEVYLTGSVETSNNDVEVSLGSLSSIKTDDDYTDLMGEDSGSITRVFNLFRTHNISGSIASGSIGFRVKSGRFHLADISVTAYNDFNFNPGFFKTKIPMPTTDERGQRYDFVAEFYDYNNNKAEVETATTSSVLFGGPRQVLGDGLDAVLTGSVLVGESVELYGTNPAYFRSIGYQGFDKTRAGTGERDGGFLIWSGSIGNGATLNRLTASEAYNGVGIEIVDASGSDTYNHSFLQFASNYKNTGNSRFRVQTNEFILGKSGSGGSEAYISGSNGTLEISSSNFALSAAGNVSMSGEISASGGHLGNFRIVDGKISGSNITMDANNSTIFKTDQGPGSDPQLSGFESQANEYYLDFTPETENPDNFFVKFGPNFMVDKDGILIASGATFEGSITASAGLIGGFTTDSHSFASTNIFISGSPIAGGNDDTRYMFISTSNFNVKQNGDVTGSNVLFDGGTIGGYTIGSTKLSSGTSFALSSSTNVNDPVSFISSSAFKVSAGGIITGSNVLFSGGDIGGFTISNQFISGGNLILHSDGRVESADFASGLKGFRLSAAQNGYLEVENASIRGTLRTTTFEKETVNAVGGQLLVANSTTISGSGGIVSASAETMSVENVSGFAVNEILMAKKFNSSGFATEYMKVESSSRADAGSDTDFSGDLMVVRGYSGSTETASGSVGDSAANSQSYEEGQVIVSTGKIGTGYIRLNANPNDPATPYIDIVERTGSAVYDVELKARLGDLSGLSQTNLLGTNPASAGFGLFSENVFLTGGIVANTGSIGGIEMQSNKLFNLASGTTATFNNANTNFYLDSSGNFSLRDKLSFNQSTGDLNIDGTITIGSLPDVGIISGSEQIASDISGSLPDNVVSSSAQIASDISGSSTSISSSLAASASSAVGTGSLLTTSASSAAGSASLLTTSASSAAATGSTLTTASSSAANVLRLTTSGVDIFEIDGTATKVASYGPTVTIGNTATEHISISSTEFKLKDGNGAGTDIDYITINSSGMQIGSVSNGITLDTDGDAVFNGTITLPAGTVSSSAQIASDISGSNNATSASLAASASSAVATGSTLTTASSSMATQVALTSNGMDLKNAAGNTTLASYGTTTTIGPTSGEHISISATAFEIKTSSTNTVLSASSAGLTMSGSITAGSGDIGGWTIGENTLTGGKVKLESSGNVNATGSTSVGGSTKGTTAQLSGSDSDGSSVTIKRQNIDNSAEIDIIRLNTTASYYDSSDYTTNKDKANISLTYGTGPDAEAEVTVSGSYGSASWGRQTATTEDDFIYLRADATTKTLVEIGSNMNHDDMINSGEVNNVVELSFQNFFVSASSANNTGKAQFQYQIEIYQSDTNNTASAELVRAFNYSDLLFPGTTVNGLTIPNTIINKQFFYFKLKGRGYDEINATHIDGNQFKLGHTGTCVTGVRYLPKVNLTGIGFQTFAGPNQEVTLGADNKIIGDLALRETNSATRGNLFVQGKAAIGSLALDSDNELYVEGDIAASGNISAYYSSDERLKDNVVRIEDGLSIINQLRPVEYEWNESSPFFHLKHNDYGLIAQEVEKVLPNIVGDMKGGYKGIKYEKLIPFLIDSIQQLTKRVEELEGK